MKKCWICEKPATKIFQAYNKKKPHYYCEKHFKMYVKPVKELLSEAKNDVLKIVYTDKGSIEHHIECCEGKHIQQVIYSTYHKALTQICFGCGVVRTSLTKEELLSSGKGGKL